MLATPTFLPVIGKHPQASALSKMEVDGSREVPGKDGIGGGEYIAQVFHVGEGFVGIQ
jgi:hypothetical protein